MKKRLIGILLAGVMAVSMMAGCGSSSGSSDSAAASRTNSSAIFFLILTNIINSSYFCPTNKTYAVQESHDI